MSRMWSSGEIVGRIDKARVERMFLASWSWCPRTVATDLGRCLVISSVVRPGKERR
jgi:hypothetical protein